MKYIAIKLRDIEKKMSDERGPFNLFALFMREDAENKWDLLVSSKWISKNKPESLKYIASNVQNALTQKELVKISRIVIIDNDDSALDVIYQSLATEHNIAEIRNSIFFGLPIQHAYIITSQKTD